jgi:hypothetical protein
MNTHMTHITDRAARRSSPEEYFAKEDVLPFATIRENRAPLDLGGTRGIRYFQISARP